MIRRLREQSQRLGERGTTPLTLPEMIVICAVIVILALVSGYTFTLARSRATFYDCISSIRNLRSAIDIAAGELGDAGLNYRQVSNPSVLCLSLTHNADCTVDDINTFVNQACSAPGADTDWEYTKNVEFDTTTWDFYTIKGSSREWKKCQICATPMGITPGTYSVCTVGRDISCPGEAAP